MRRWARILGIVFILFTTLFSFDAFEGSASLGQALARLLLHLIPSLVLALVLAIAWRRERLGGALYLVLGAAIMLVGLLNGGIPSPLSIPLLLLGGLFLRAADTSRQRGIEA